MLPVVLNFAKLKIAVAGQGDLLLKRLKNLKNSGASDLDIYASKVDEELLEYAGSKIKTGLPDKHQISSYNILILAGLSDEVAFPLAKIARENKVLVNVEDRMEYCDFYFCSSFNRGNLVVAVNSLGESPALAVRIRKYLEQLIPVIWDRRLEEIATLRKSWKDSGDSSKTIIAKTNEYIDEKKWLD